MDKLPSVVAVMLTKDRTEMARRAINCFRAQTYPNKKLVIVNSWPTRMTEDGAGDIIETCYMEADSLTIGCLRNQGNAMASVHGADIIMHWDDDDWSSPERMWDQVTLMVEAAVEVVGYNDMLFRKEAVQLTNADVYGADECERGGIELRCGADVLPAETWLYSGSVLGTSLCYRTSLWKRKPFRDTSKGEDASFVAGERLTTESSLRSGIDPYMIATIHGRNTSSQIFPEASEWMRAEEYSEVVTRCLSK